MARKSDSGKSTSSAPLPLKSESTPSGMVAPITAKSMVCAIPSKEKTTDTGYEVVHPPSSSRINSLSDRTKSWWRRKNKRQRQITTVQLAGTLTMIGVILIILIVIGGWLAYEYGRRKDEVDERLTTRTHVCREYYKDKDDQAECMYEDWAQRPNCSSKLQCKKRLWKLFQLGDKPLPFFKHDTQYSPIPTTDYTDCGFQQWCIEEKCVEKRTGWYQSHDLKLEGMADPWVERKVDELPCLERGIDMQFLSDIENKFQECNVETCQNENATYGLLVKFYSCDRPTPDKTIGVRMDDCVGQPMNVFACHRCDPRISIAPVTHCDPEKDNGVLCLSSDRVCFYGGCHPVDTTYLE